MITLFFKEYESEAEDILKKCTHIYCDKEVFVCGYKTKSRKTLDKADMWYVYYAAGNIKKLFNIFEPMKYICFHRLETYKLKIYNYEKLRKRLWAEKKAKFKHPHHPQS